jgi:hypothetical protein
VTPWTRDRRFGPFVGAALALALIAGCSERAGAEAAWPPEPGVTWQWQLSGAIDESVEGEVYNVDLFETHRSVVSSLHARGRHVICYMSAGSWERWRPDAGRFPESVRGRSNGWPGERWLDIRRFRVLKPLMRERLDRCVRKGFDGVEFDNVDGYANRTGFRLTARDQLAYNSWLAQAAHARGLAAGLKNDLGQIKALEPLFDFAINEECFYYDECERLTPFIEAGKAVFHVEYELQRSEFCEQARALGFSSLKKRWNLGVWRRSC